MANPNTAAFPTAVATDADLLVAQNSGRSTLSSPIDNLATTITIPVADGSVFSVPTLVTIGTETIKIASKVGNVLTAAVGGRAFHGTIANHASGDAVIAYVDQHYTNQLAAEVMAVETGLGAAFANTALLNRTNLWTPDNTYDIGASGASRPRSVYVGTDIKLGGVLRWGAGTNLSGGGTDGVIALYNSAQADFGRLQFGGTTASFPALKRSGTEIQARLADDSGYATLTAATLKVSAGSSISGSATDGVILITNLAGADFGRLQFGGTTASFPALKRSGTEIQARLADDSGYATLTAGTLKFGDGTTMTTASVAGTATVASTSAASYTVTAGASTVVLINAGGNNVAVTLFTAVGNTGSIVNLKRTDASTSFTVTIAGNSAQTMDGAAALSITRQNDSYTLVSDGSNWRLI